MHRPGDYASLVADAAVIPFHIIAILAGVLAILAMPAARARRDVMPIRRINLGGGPSKDVASQVKTEDIAGNPAYSISAYSSQQL